MVHVAVLGARHPDEKAPPDGRGNDDRALRPLEHRRIHNGEQFHALLVLREARTAGADGERAEPGRLRQRAVLWAGNGQPADHQDRRGRRPQDREPTPPSGDNTPPSARHQSINVRVCRGVSLVAEGTTQVVNSSRHRVIPSRAEPVRSGAASSRSSSEMRSAASALKVWDFTVPTLVPIASAVAASV